MANKIISMSIWGDNPRYIIGTKKQVALAKKYYPEWTSRVYTDDIHKFDDIKDDCELIQVNDDTWGFYWRFFPLYESEDNIVMVRDPDSRITIREQMCIAEWLESDKKFHTFKDHEAHYEFPIIGCAYAYKGKFNQETLDTMTYFMNEHKYYLSDQIFLRDVIYPQVKDNMMLHSMYEGWFGESRKLLKNKYSFCGNGYYENDMPIYPDSLSPVNTFDIDSQSEEFKFDEGLMVDYV
jgi:hypothetical protein